MRLSVARAHERFHLMRKTPRGRTDRPRRSAAAPTHQRRDNGAFERGFLAGEPRRKPRRVDDDVNLLGSLHLKNFGDRPAAPRGRFPVNLIESVAGHVFAKFFELAAAPSCRMHVHAAGAAAQRLQIVIAAKIGIHANFAARWRRGWRTVHNPSGDGASR